MIRKQLVVLVVLGVICFAAQSFAAEGRPDSHRGFSLETGVMFNLHPSFQNGSTGEFYDPPLRILEFGINLGGHWQFNDKNSVGIWGNTGIGDISMVLLSHFSLGATYLRGNKVDGFAMGPSIGIVASNANPLVGVEIFFKNIYIRPSFAIELDSIGQDDMIWEFHVDIGYSFYFGR